MIKKYWRLKPLHALLCFSVVALTVAIDFISKRLVMANMKLGESVAVIKGVFNFTYITNDGAAFGSFSEHRWVFMVLSVVFIAVLTCSLCVWEEDKLFYISASMVIGGGIGNMIDRIAYGTVVDFLDFCAFPSLWKWIFNAADSFVCVGAALLVLYYIRFEVKNAREKKAGADGQDGADTGDGDSDKGA